MTAATASLLTISLVGEGRTKRSKSPAVSPTGTITPIHATTIAMSGKSTIRRHGGGGASSASAAIALPIVVGTVGGKRSRRKRRKADGSDRQAC
jgi:hypothetical protein